MPNDDEEPLSGGGLSPVTRKGLTIRRKTGEWTPAVHALLDHLDRVGFNGAPKPLGLDSRGREVLTYIEGVPGDAAGGSDDELKSAARLIRHYHEAAATFESPPDAAWRYMVGAPRTGQIICHNDLAPVNTIYDGNEAVGLIDWDFAAPASPKWDVAYALYRYVPLYDDLFFDQLGRRPPDRIGRIRLFCDEYGLGDRIGLLDLVRQRVQVLHDSVRQWAAAGTPEFEAIWRDTHGKQWLRSIRFVTELSKRVEPSDLG
jgi:hypothetical protein